MRSIAAAFVLIPLLVVPVCADVDLSVDWEIYTSVEGTTEITDAVVTQVGTDLTIALYFTVMTGTIDPVTGVFSVDGFDPSCAGMRIDGAAGADGNTFSGQAGRQFFNTFPLGCFEFYGQAYGARKACGNGLHGSSEACDDGNTDDGDCCSSACDMAEPTTTVCRPAADACDIVETCRSDGICPSDLHFDDYDGDGRCSAIDGCETSLVASASQLRSGTYDGAAGNDRLRWKAVFTLADPNAVDPVTYGVGVSLYDTDGIGLDVTIPGGSYDAVTGTGWKDNGRGTRKFASRVPVGGAINRVTLRIPSSRPQELQVAVVGRRGSHAPATVALPIYAAMAFPGIGPGFGVCGESRFPGPPGVAPSCTLRPRAATVICR